MRKLKTFIIVFLLLSNIIYSQSPNYGINDFVKEINKKSSKIEDKVIIDTKLLPYIESYLKDAKKHLNKNLRPELYKLDSVIVKELPYLLMGKTIMRNWKMKKVYINKWATMDTLILKSVVYHELTHALLKVKDHPCLDCIHLLAENPPASHIIFYKNWDKYVRELFDTYKKK